MAIYSTWGTGRDNRFNIPLAASVEGVTVNAVAATISASTNDSVTLTTTPAEGTVVLIDYTPYTVAASGGTSDTQETTQVGVRTAVEGVNTAIGARANASATDDTGTFSLISLTKRGLEKYTVANSRLTDLDAGVGDVADSAAAADGTGNYSLISAVKRALLNWSTLLARIPASLTAVPNSDQAAIPMRLVGQTLGQAGFSAVGASVLDTFFVQTPAVTGGTTFSQSTGSLSIVSPATANSEFLARAVTPYRSSQRLRFSTVLSQRIVNNNFAVLLADLLGENLAYTIISATQVNVTLTAHGFTAQNVGQFINLGAITGAAGVPGRYAIASIVDVNTIQFTVAGWPGSGSGTLTLFGRNYIRSLFNGTTATAAGMDAQRNGWATGDTAATINTTAPAGTVIQAEFTGREVFFADSLRATATTPNFVTRASRYENIPDPTIDLYVFVWAFNGSTAPVSPTTWTIGHLSVERFANIPVYIQGNRSLGTQNPYPVQVSNTVPTTIASGTVTTVSTVTTLTGGSVAEDAATTSSPHIVGGVVRAAATPPITFIAGDAVRDTMTTGGAKLVMPYSTPEANWTYTGAAAVTNTTDVVLAAAAGASLRRYITGLQVKNTNATATEIVVKDGATVIWRGHVSASMVNGDQITFPTPLRSTANAALNFACITTAANVYVNAQGFTAP